MTDLLMVERPVPPEPEVVSKQLPRWIARDRLVAIAVTLVTWVSVAGPATSYVDDSWRFTLWAALQNGVDWGNDLAFTYGPLAFLDGGPMHSRAATLCVVVVRACVVYWFCRLVLNITRTLGINRIRAVVATLLMVIFIVPAERLSELVVSLAIAWIVHTLLTRGWLSSGQCAGFAALAGVWAAVKPSTGLLLVAVVAIGSGAPNKATTPDRALMGSLIRAAASVLVALAAFAVAWTGSGQDLASVPGFLGGWFEVSGGFAQGMISLNRLVQAEVLLIGVGIGLGAALVTRWSNERVWSNSAVLLISAGVIFWARQIGMARADGPHLRDTAVVFTLLALVMIPHLSKRFGTILFAVAFVLAATLSFHIALPLRGGPWNVASDVLALASDDSVGQRRLDLADEYQIPQSITDRIAGATVHFSPVDTNIGFAHPEIGFWMLPTVQHYVSYTAVLEERNAEALTGPGGPAFILHKPTSKVDKHNTAWESPLLMHTIWCSFEPIDTGNGWTLFEPTGSSCESVRQLGPAVVLSGSEVVMPPDVRACDGLVTFRINGAERSEVDRLMQLAIRLPRTTVNIADKEWPLFTATANQPHIIAAPESDLGWLGKGTESPAGLASSMEVDGLGGYFGLHTAPELVFECWQKP